VLQTVEYECRVSSTSNVLEYSITDPWHCAPVLRGLCAGIGAGSELFQEKIF